MDEDKLKAYHTKYLILVCLFILFLLVRPFAHDPEGLLFDKIVYWVDYVAIVVISLHINFRIFSDLKNKNK